MIIPLILMMFQNPKPAHRHKPVHHTAVKPISLSAEDLWLAYRDNTVRGNALYRGKRILLTGYINGVDLDGFTDDSILSVTLEGGSDFESVICYFQNTHKNRLALINADSKTATILCTVVGRDIYPQVDHCTLIKTTDKGPWEN